MLFKFVFEITLFKCRTIMIILIFLEWRAVCEGVSEVSGRGWKYLSESDFWKLPNNEWHNLQSFAPPTASNKNQDRLEQNCVLQYWKGAQESVTLNLLSYLLSFHVNLVMFNNLIFILFIIFGPGALMDTACYREAAECTLLTL